MNQLTLEHVITLYKEYTQEKNILDRLESIPNNSGYMSLQIVGKPLLQGLSFKEDEFVLVKEFLSDLQTKKIKLLQDEISLLGIELDK